MGTLQPPSASSTSPPTIGSKANRPPQSWAEWSEEPDPDQDDPNLEAMIEPPPTDVHNTSTSSTPQPRRRKPRLHRRERPIDVNICVPDLTDASWCREASQTTQMPSTSDQDVFSPPSTCNYAMDSGSEDDELLVQIATAEKAVASAELKEAFAEVVKRKAIRDLRSGKRSRSSQGSSNESKPDEKVQRVRSLATSAPSPISLLPVMEIQTGDWLMLMPALPTLATQGWRQRQTPSAQAWIRPTSRSTYATTTKTEPPSVPGQRRDYNICSLPPWPLPIQPQPLSTHLELHHNELTEHNLVNTLGNPTYRPQRSRA